MNYYVISFISYKFAGNKIKQQQYYEKQPYS